VRGQDRIAGRGAEFSMKRALLIVLSLITAAFATSAHADAYGDTIALFKESGQSASFFDNSYGYAVFPTIGKGGIGVGGARGTGRVFRQGKHVGDVTMTQLSIGAQLGGQAFSQIIFFQDQRAFDEFTSGNFEFDAGVSAVAITAAAGARAGTAGANAGASGGSRNAVTAGDYHKGLAIFTIVRGGAMYAVTVAGQKFRYTPLSTQSAKAPGKEKAESR
jgi:lipid-binding SYLF domain-containing protein